MSFLNNFFNLGASKKAQDNYKKSAKSKGLLQACLSENGATLDYEKFLTSFEELKKENDFDTALEVLKEVNESNLSFSVTGQADLSKESRGVIYTNKNFHGLNFSQKEMDEMVEFANQEGSVLVNTNHLQIPEYYIGEVSNLKVEDDKISADTSKVNFNHPAFALQKYAIENEGCQLGWSVELRFDDVLLSFKTWTLKFVDPRLRGLATTLIPSAPGTLQNEGELTSQGDKNLDETTPKNEELESQKVDLATYEHLKAESEEKDKAIDELLSAYTKLTETLSIYQKAAENSTNKLNNLTSLAKKTNTINKIY